MAPGAVSLELAQGGELPQGAADGPGCWGSGWPPLSSEASRAGRGRGAFQEPGFRAGECASPGSAKCLLPTPAPAVFGRLGVASVKDPP